MKKTRKNKGNYQNNFMLFCFAFIKHVKGLGCLAGLLYLCPHRKE